MPLATGSHESKALAFTISENDSPWEVYRREQLARCAKPLKSQKALVTGANSGIGEACAIPLGAAGADVVVNFVSQLEEAERVAESIRQSGTRVIAFHADVSREDQSRPCSPKC
jgi:hypothetical protein